jgi:small GTP-binding protein
MPDTDKEMNEFMEWFLTDDEASAPTPPQEITVMKKICMLGDPGVGKTSLVARFVFSMFDDKYIETIGAKVTKRTMALEHIATKQRFRVKLMIWDIAGQKTLDFIKPTYYRDAEGAILISDFTRKETLVNVSKWCQSIQSVCGKIPIVMMVNKSDLKGSAQYTGMDAQKLGISLDAQVYMSSAKTGDNVEAAFSALGRKLVKNYIDQQE